MQREGNHLFGLCNGQIRAKDFVHNGLWYNKLGEKIGSGDLSTEDFLTIRRELEEGEMFIILSEHAYSLDLIRKPGLLDVNALDVDYVAAKAKYIITKPTENGFGMYVVDNFRRKEDQINLDGLMFHVMKREDAKAFLTSNTGVTVASAS